MKEVKFNLDEDILFQIAMMTYDKCNSEIATIYDHLGEEYGYSDLQAAKEYELRYEKDLLEKAVFQLQARRDRYKCKLDKLKFAIKSNCIKEGNKYQEICCDGDYLLSIIDGSDEE